MNVELQLNAAGRSLLGKLESKEITESEFDIEIAYMMLAAGIQHMRYHKDPPVPEAVYELRRRKNYDVGPDFWNQPDVKNWASACSFNRAENYGNWHWLNELRHVVPPGDVKNHRVITDVMDSYREHHKRV